jgi:CspA family cold shock protein
MSNIVVELVKYDTLKTKKRKRSDLLVESKSEASVIEKLERIHKGDKIETIHEIIWKEVAEEAPEEIGEVLTGTIKYFDSTKGFGFIQPEADIEDLFFHVSALNGEEVYDNDPVQFEIGQGKKGEVAIRVRLTE